MEVRERNAQGGGAGVGRASVTEELAQHELLLRQGRPAVRVAVARERTLSYGIAVPSEAPYLRRARAEGIPTAARSTGGSGVLHLEGDLLWAVVLPRSDERVGRDFPKAYARLGRGIVAGLAAAGVDAAWVAAPGLSEDCCPLSSRGEVLVAGGRILGGAAQHATSRALLHHGGISWIVDRPCVDRLFGLPADGPSSRLGGLAGLTGPGEPASTGAVLARALGDELER